MHLCAYLRAEAAQDKSTPAETGTGAGPEEPLPHPPKHPPNQFALGVFPGVPVLGDFEHRFHKGLRATAIMDFAIGAKRPTR